jgi:predicted ArsR family transcriptional regulator
VADEIGRRLGISPSNLQRLINIQEKRGVCMFSSADLAFYLNVTSRSASRILARLAEDGCAKVAWNSQPNSRGRPYKIYEVNYRELYSRLMTAL